MSRPSKSNATRETQQTLMEAGLYGSKLVRDILRGTTLAPNGNLVKMKRVSGVKLVAAKLAIEHSIGLPKAKIELKTDALTMKDIAELAHTFGDGGLMSDNNGDEEEIILVPTKPLTPRQIRERAQN